MREIGVFEPPPPQGAQLVSDSLYGWMAAAGKHLNSRFERRSAAIRGEILKQVQDDSIRWPRNSGIYVVRVAQKDI